jgi:lipopolysaccharide biosynthesis regulator YciM
MSAAPAADFIFSIFNFTKTPRGDVVFIEPLRANVRKSQPIMTRQTLSLSALCLSLTMVAGAQMAPAAGAPNLANPGIRADPNSKLGPMYSGAGGVLIVSVINDKKAQLDRQAVVKLYDENRQKTLWQATSDSSDTTFVDLMLGKYDVEVSAMGYLPAHKVVDVLSLDHSNLAEIVLQRDPDAYDFNASSEGLPAKASKENRRAISALSIGKLKDAQKHLDTAYKIAPSSSRINFLMGYLSFEQKNLEQSQTYLEKAIAIEPRNVQMLTLLGRVYLANGKTADAQSVLQRAVATDAESWSAHNLLADAYLRQHDNANALAQANLAVDSGKPGSDTAQITRGEALANLGHDDEAIQAFMSYLQSEPGSPTVPQVRDLIAQVHNHIPIAAQPDDATVGKNDLLLASAQPTLSLKAWAPPGIDDAKPPVASGVTCPYDEIIEKSGESVKQLVENVAQFSAIEDLLHERLDDTGNPATKDVRKFDYVAAISEPKPGILAVDEFRTEKYGVDDLPDQIRTNGFPALALVFHPDMRDNFDIRCEGLGQLRGQATWLLHFEQRADRPNRLQEYKIGNQSYSVALKGRAWVSADRFQIVRMETELMHPMPGIQLLAEHQITEYGPVAFPKKNVELWLPKSAEVYLELRKHYYYRRHSFDHFMLFSVDSSDKVREAKGTHGPGSLTPKKKKHWWA